MANLLRNALAVVAGIVIGGGVNMALIALSPSLIPPLDWLAIRIGARMRALGGPAEA